MIFIIHLINKTELASDGSGHSGNGSAYLFTSKEALCDYFLSLGHLSTLNGKIDMAIYVVLSLFLLLANGILVYGMIKTKDTKSNTAKLLLLLNITELIISSFLVAFHEYIHFHGQGEPSCHFYATEQFLSVFLGTTATIITFFMSLDRFIFIRLPMVHSKWNGKLPVIQIIVFLSYGMAVSAGVFIYSIIHNNMNHNINKRAVSLFTNLLALFSVVLVAVLTMNFLLTHYIRQQAKHIDSLSNITPLKKYQHRASKTVLWISLIQIVTLLPPVIAFSIVIHIFGSETYETDIDLIYYVTSWLMIPIFLISTLNAIVYFSRSRKLKGFYKKQILKYGSSFISNTFVAKKQPVLTTPAGRVATLASTNTNESYINESYVMTTPDLKVRFAKK